MQLSVIICCHNPRIDYFARVLEALKAQTLSTDNWELLVVDNASEGSVAASHNISWHPNAHHVREENLGLTCARLRGIAEASADLLVFVDDDNVIAENYLDVATQIATDWRCLGAWGGQQLAEFEGGEPREAWISRRSAFERDRNVDDLSRGRRCKAVHGSTQEIPASRNCIGSRSDHTKILLAGRC